MHERPSLNGATKSATSTFQAFSEIIKELKDDDKSKENSFRSHAIPRYYKKLGGDDRKQGDTILYYLEHKWKKPTGKTPQQHYHRMVELIQIAEKLEAFVLPCHAI
eukprot:g3636.t1 g3636   contig12:2471986-2472303(+)